MQREDVNKWAQKVSKVELEALYKKIDEVHGVKVLNAPTEQTLLVPVKDPISDGDFYSGEVLVTSCIVQVVDYKGWSMIMDSDVKCALYIATLDACFEMDEYKSEIILLLEQAQKKYEIEQLKRNQYVNSTRVSFDLM